MFYLIFCQSYRQVIGLIFSEKRIKLFNQPITTVNFVDYDNPDKNRGQKNTNLKTKPTFVELNEVNHSLDAIVSVK